MSTIIFTGLDPSRLALADMAEITARSAQEGFVVYIDEAEDLCKQSLLTTRPDLERTYLYGDDCLHSCGPFFLERRRPDYIDSEPRRTKQQRRGRVKTQHQRLGKGWY